MIYVIEMVTGRDTWLKFLLKFEFRLKFLLKFEFWLKFLLKFEFRLVFRLELFWLVLRYILFLLLGWQQNHFVFFHDFQSKFIDTNNKH